MEDFVFDKDAPHLGGNIDGGDSFTYCPGAWKYLVNTFKVKSVADVGCGQGRALKWFQDNSCSVLGVEGLQSNADKANQLLNEEVGMRQDLQTGTVCLPLTDLVWCCELVEHVEEQYIGNLLPLLVAPVLAMSYAEVGQEGHHHVNCQPEEYWISVLADIGMAYDADLTHRTQIQDKHNNHFGWHGLVFRSELL